MNRKMPTKARRLFAAAAIVAALAVMLPTYLPITGNQVDSLRGFGLGLALGCVIVGFRKLRQPRTQDC
jgi:hypothetical protein